MTRSISELAQDALDVQDACNLSSVVISFAKALDDLWLHATALNKGTDWVNQHPITKAFTSKLMSLSGWTLGDGTFAEVISLASKAA